MIGMREERSAGRQMRIRDRSYYQERAEAEIEAAHQASHPAAARAHYVLAAHYLDLAHNPDGGPDSGGPDRGGLVAIGAIPALAPAAT
jgi:hypothetical protein